MWQLALLFSISLLHLNSWVPALWFVLLLQLATLTASLMFIFMCWWSSDAYQSYITFLRRRLPTTEFSLWKKKEYDSIVAYWIADMSACYCSGGIVGFRLVLQVGFWMFNFTIASILSFFQVMLTKKLNWVLSSSDQENSNIKALKETFYGFTLLKLLLKRHAVSCCFVLTVWISVNCKVFFVVYFSQQPTW